MPVGQSKETTAVRLLVEYLKGEGVEYIFGIPGAPLMPFYEALHDMGGIKPILAKHEGGAAFMADGYARAGGKLGVCCSTTGPGATNLLTGVACSFADSIPLLVLTAQVSTSSFGKGAVQESTCHGIDVVEMFKPVTKSSVMLHSPEKMGDVFRSLLRVALSGRKGPVHLNIPVDFMKKNVKAHIVPPNCYRVTAGQFDRNAVKEASRLLLKARHPAILAGNGVNLAGAQKELRRLAELLRIPVATSPKAKGAFPENHILSLGVFGFGASAQAEKYLLSGEVDVLLVVGTSLGEPATCGWDLRLEPSEAMVQMDIDPKEIGKNYPATQGILGDAKAVLNELNYQLERDSRWLEKGPLNEREEKITKFKTGVSRFDAPEKMFSGAVPLKPQRIMKEMRDILPDDAILFIDIGTAMFWALHYFPVYEPDTFYINMGLGSMGHAVAGCIGGKLARPDKPVVALTGDAAFAMNGMEVHTASEIGVPVIWIVLNNGGHGMVYHGERLQFSGKFATGIFKHPIDVAGIGRSLGAEVFEVSDGAGFSSALESALKTEAPCVIDVRVDIEEMPPMGHRIKTLDKIFAG
ncbi:MAG: thiamine pyrophosphate-binding protein [Elusimicrobia bacterium CG08_land_8_20_14_0_20_51_18]|nr:MAG: thiamine pyrophosphate-binding protein [Elusimicrobia bacterium CG08_land_8_20_14_0_20_51_18]